MIFDALFSISSFYACNTVVTLAYFHNYFTHTFCCLNSIRIILRCQKVLGPSLFYLQGYLPYSVRECLLYIIPSSCLLHSYQGDLSTSSFQS